MFNRERRLFEEIKIYIYLQTLLTPLLFELFLLQNAERTLHHFASCFMIDSSGGRKCSRKQAAVIANNFPSNYFDCNPHSLVGVLPTKRIIEDKR